MNQNLRICIYYCAIVTLAYILIRFVPVHFHPSKWQIKKIPEVAITNIDSIGDLSLTDTLLVQIPVDTSEVEKDTVITKHHLSCPAAFIKQIKQLHHKLITSSGNNKNIRILHFGDSQIEGDRITAYLRESFQSRFGGSGPGLTTVYDPQRINPSVRLNSKGGWLINSIFNRKNKLPNNEYGLMGQVASLHANSIGQFNISASPWAGKHASNYQKVRLFIAPHSDTIIIKGNIKSTEVINDSLSPSTALTEINWEFEQLSPSLSFELFSKADIHIFGCALDSINGVTVDNIALRGQSSPLLHRTNGELFKAMGEHLDIGMIIFQFGTNIIPTIAPNYHFYKVLLARQFNLLRKYLPHVPVLVIGISDAAHFKDGTVKPFEHLYKIRDAQKSIALENNFAFFDLYEAMGGKGSIIEWNKKSPPWAMTDYIHFSRKGGQKVANLLTTALWYHFDKIEIKKISVDMVRK